MNEQGGPRPPMGPSEIPSLEALRQNAMREIAAEEPEPAAVETESSVEVVAPAYKPDPMVELSAAMAEAQDYKRALALEYLKMSPTAEVLPDDPSASIHSVHVKGHRTAKRTTDERAQDLIERRHAREMATRQRPDWEDHMPKADDPGSVEKYQTWLKQQPITMQLSIEGLRQTTDVKNRLLADTAVADQWKELGEKQQVAMKAAATVRVAERRGRQITKEIIEVRGNARADGRKLTPADETYIALMQEAATKIQAEAKGLLGFPEVHKEVMRRDLIESARQLKAGFLETDDMRQLIEQVVPSLVEGMPLLLFGETGGAKTALGRHLALEYFGVDPEMVSGHAEVNAYQVMGKTGLRASGEGTESVFDPGPMFTAMAEGKPCILDEVDAMPASFLLRLQYILQLRPGDTYKVQEDSNESITVKAGFCIIATANMKSARYIREKMDPAFMQRFRSGAGIKHIPYPDNDITEGGVPTDNIRLMLAFLADEKGATREVPGISRASEDKRLFNLMKAAHASQRMFTQPASTLSGASQSMVLDSGRLAQGKPALDEAVLAPREWMGILSQVINSDGKVTLENALADFVAGQTVDNDRAVLGRLLAAHDLLDGVNEADLRLPPGALNGFRKTVVAAPEAPDATPATP